MPPLVLLSVFRSPHFGALSLEPTYPGFSLAQTGEDTRPPHHPTPDDSTATKELAMQHELRIAFRNMDVSEALEKRIRTRAAELEQLCDRITACDVVVEMQHRHAPHGKMFHVRVDLALPGRTIVVRREPPAQHAHEDAHAAVR